MKNLVIIYTKTVIGGGPKGETVVLKVDKENPNTQQRLWKKFEASHLYYAEVKHDGPVYVLGGPETHESFKQLYHLPYTHTRIGAGPGGATLVFEVDKDNSALQYRRIHTDASRTGVQL